MKTRLNPTENPVTYALLVSAIDPIVKWCSEGRGRKSDLLRAMQAAAAPEIIHRSILESWIRDDPSQRNQPSLAAGLLLIQTATALGILSPADIFTPNHQTQ
jgi:hypothetical protein